jgi:CRP-like cAMP-binding protein
MLSALVQKLDSLEPLSDEAKSHLARLPARLANLAPREELVAEAQPRGDVRVVVEGVAARVKVLDAGGRQAILGLLLPGDVDEADAFVEALDHGIVALTACKIAQIPRLPFDQLLLDFPDLARAFRRMARRGEAIARVWLANMGQRSADRQAAHLLCELHARLSALGMGGADWFTNPLTQEQLANVLGISAVHMNRVMQHLRELGLIRVEGHVLRFPSPRKMEEYAGFDGGYLAGEGRAATPKYESHHARAPRGERPAPMSDGRASAAEREP